MLQRNLKSGQITRISSISKNYTNLMNGKQDGICSYKTITLSYSTFQEKQIQK